MKSTSLPKRKRVQLTFNEPSLTEQTHKQSCDINYIIKKFSQTGQLLNENTMEKQYGEAPAIDLKSALDLVKNSHQEFNELSPEIKAAFSENPDNYFEFLHQYAEAPESFSNESADDIDTSVSKTKANAENHQPDPSNEDKD